MKAIPIELKEANAFVETLHRHHDPVHRDKWRIGCITDDGILCGVIQVGRPRARELQDGFTCEVLRLCTDGTPNVCSYLYSRAARIAKEMGYKRIITYILESEPGTSLKASGWRKEADTKGRSWNTPSRPRVVIEEQLSLFGENKPKYSTENKQRWEKRFEEQGETT